MGERRATNKYYPPDWTPSAGSINAFRGQHPLRDRARKLSQGILIVRFEMPFNVWCLGCNNHIGKGVRYNAEKKQVGMYFTTKIWSFRMKCHLCSNWIEIHTDPQHAEYSIVSGARRKEETWEATTENGVIPFASEEETKKLAEDAFYRLEHAQEDAQKGQSLAPVLGQLIAEREVWKDDYAVSQRLRGIHRKVRHEHEALRQEARAKGLAIRLLPKDAAADSTVDYESEARGHATAPRPVRHTLQSSRVFPGGPQLSSAATRLLQQATRKRQRLKLDGPAVGEPARKKHNHGQAPASANVQ